MPKKIKNIVCLGGGNAMPKAVLEGLKKYPVKITAISSVLDSGGSTGRLRKKHKIIGLGDLRRIFITLANVPLELKELLNYRFEKGRFKGHNFGNLIILTSYLKNKDWPETLEIFKKILKIKHQIFPVTLDNANLFAVLENGKIISGETNIDIPKHNPKLKIKKVFLRPPAKAYPPVLTAIKKADLIVIGPGDLYSSISQILLAKGVSGAIKKSKAKKVYICNLMTKRGETNNFSVLDFAKEIEKYLKTSLDYLIYNIKKPPKREFLIYKKKHPELLNLVKIDKNLKKNFIGRNLLLSSGGVLHDSKKLAKILLKL